MENQKLNRVFDRVKLSPEREEAMLADLLREKEEASSMKRRRIVPAGVLVAAVLVAVLAGRAVAAARLGRVEVSPLENDYENGYRVRGCFESVSTELLSEELRERAAQLGNGDDRLTFDSWDETEEFLGLHIAGNSMLGRMKPVDWVSPEEYNSMPEECRGYRVWLRCSAGTVDMIAVNSDYYTREFEEEDFSVNVKMFLRVRESESRNAPFTIKYPMSKQVSVEKYVTPSGMEVSIVANEWVGHTGDGDTFKRPRYDAYFDLNGAFFHVAARYNNPEKAGWTLDLLKQVLDAYE